MNNLFLRTLLLIPFVIIVATGCAKPYDYSALIKSSPKSIVVIPPENNTVEVNAPYIYLSTISRPLAEKGYYVFPVAVIDQFLKENGLPTPAEMNGIPLDKIGEHIGADAVLYVSIEDWGQKYQIISSVARVEAKVKLVDTKTGDLLWDTTVQAQKSSDDGGGGLLGAVVGAIITQVLATTIADSTPELSRQANMLAINNGVNGLLNGPYRQPDEKK